MKLQRLLSNLKQAQVSLNSTVRYLSTENGTGFINQTLWNYAEEVRITHHTSTTRTSQQNGVVETRNRTLVEATRTMLIFSKSSLFLWAEAVASACYTQNHSLIHTRYDKTPYELLRDHKPELKYLYVFGALCYLTNDLRILGNFILKQTLESSLLVSEQHDSGPELQRLNSGYISLGLVLNKAASTSAKPSIQND
ncbi:retrovirus-related pol polyprotein from transposon TNT 1-94 [Tanacetum coccineum]